MHFVPVRKRSSGAHIAKHTSSARPGAAGRSKQLDARVPGCYIFRLLVVVVVVVAV